MTLNVENTMAENFLIIIIVSDLHIGDGSSRDDHVYNDRQFERFIGTLLTDSSAKEGQVELIINGDFLEFAQVQPDVYSLRSAEYWCSEKESMAKLEAILKGHIDIFKALANFTKCGNRLTIAAGNHDVDLYWPSVQQKLVEKLGTVNFELGNELYSRYDNSVVIGHGHMYDPANRFEHWRNPILKTKAGETRLEMCTGTLFMVKFVNWLEEKYPFADNVIPITVLERLLRKESKLGYLSVAWVLSKFVARHPIFTAGLEPNSLNLREVIKDHFDVNSQFRKALIGMYSDSYQVAINEVTCEAVSKALDTDEGLEKMITNLIVMDNSNHWVKIFNKKDIRSTMSIGGDDSRTAAIVRSGSTNEKEELRKKAQNLLSNGAQIVVFGHTHQPDTLEEDEKKYFNPGSWTRYLKLEKLENLSLEDLKDEEDFPYQLNFVRIEKNEEGQLISKMVPFESQKGKRFAN